MTTVVGLGQLAAGDDAVGLWVARALRAEGIAARESSDATLLLSLLEQGEHVIVVDAAVGDLPPGTVRHVRSEDLARSELRPLSSHGLSVAQALELAGLLYPDARARVELVAIAIAPPGPARAWQEGLSPTVSAALAKACVLVRGLIHETAGEA